LVVVKSCGDGNHSNGDISMRKLFFSLALAIMIVVSSCSQKVPDNFVLVKGGTFKNTKSNFYGRNITLSDFCIGKYEVTQKDWVEVMGGNPSTFKEDDLPVETVSWYDCVEYCNKRSLREGLKPIYNIEKNEKDPRNTNPTDSLKWTVTINANANGYRLPTEEEWEYAAGGGQMSKSFTYSGSDDVDEIAWYWKNSGDKILDGYWNLHMIEGNHCKTKPVGLKKPNELGLYDMSGNVREWCWEWLESNGYVPQGRRWRGGGWLGGDEACKVSFWMGSWGANQKGNDTGLRVCLGM